MAYKYRINQQHYSPGQTIMILYFTTAISYYSFAYIWHGTTWLILQYYCMINPHITQIAACSPPTQDGILIPPIQITQRDDLVTFTCKEGYSTSEELTAQCLCNGTWTVDPNDVICTGDP